MHTGSELTCERLCENQRYISFVKLKTEMEPALGEVKQKNVTEHAGIGEILAPIICLPGFDTCILT